MENRLLLVYDRKENDPIHLVAQTLVNAEADFIVPVLNTSIEFIIYTDSEHELEWVIKTMLEELSEVAYVKIYQYVKSWGPGKKHNKSQMEDAPGYIGKTLEDYLTAARVNPNSFRKRYIKLFKENK